jgi:hypothetical protein
LHPEFFNTINRRDPDTPSGVVDSWFISDDGYAEQSYVMHTQLYVSGSKCLDPNHTPFEFWLYVGLIAGGIVLVCGVACFCLYRKGYCTRLNPFKRLEDGHPSFRNYGDPVPALAKYPPGRTLERE